MGLPTSCACVVTAKAEQTVQPHSLCFCLICCMGVLLGLLLLLQFCRGGVQGLFSGTAALGLLLEE